MFSVLRENYENCFILESVDNSNQWGRYSFIGLNPKAEIKVKEKKAEFIYSDGRHEERDASDPVKLFSELMDKYRSPKFINRPKLTGGLNEKNISEALEICENIDLSGGIETEGVKDREKIKRVMEIYREITERKFYNE